VWVELLANVMDRPVRVVGTVEAAAHGAAILAATSQGLFGSVQEACSTIVELGPPVEPSADAAAYAEPYAVYGRLYPQLRATFERLSRLDV
jgi:xylulokinase